MQSPMVRGFVAVTDTRWLDFLSKLDDIDEVNFWRPTPTAVRQPVGTPWFLKARAPVSAIVGGGFFAHYTDMPLYLAWDTFREKNGMPTLQDFESAISRIRRSTHDEEPTAVRATKIGCVILTQPYFFSPVDYVDAPEDFARQIVTGKAYDLTSGPGLALWNAVQNRLAARSTLKSASSQPISAMLGKPHLVTPRLGQGGFRISVIDAYERRCAVTGERTLPALDAAHIRPFSDVQRHEVVNGLTLRSDIHRLFDQGYVTVDPALRFRVSQAIKTEFENGRDYYALHEKPIRIPPRLDERPDEEALRWHSSTIYRGD